MDSGNHVVGDGKGIAVQFFLDGDLSDPATPFIGIHRAAEPRGQNAGSGMALQLRQSHGWLDGTLDASSLDLASHCVAIMQRIMDHISNGTRYHILSLDVTCVKYRDPISCIHQRFS